MKTMHYFEVPLHKVKEFTAEANIGDELGGFEFEIVKDAGDHIVFILSRALSYPYRVNNLREIEGNQK